MANDLSPGSLGGASGYATFWKGIFSIASSSATTLGLFPTLATLRRFLDKMDGIVANEDFDAAQGVKESGEFAGAQAALADLTKIIASLPDRAKVLLKLIGTGTRPMVAVGPGDTPPPPIAWAARDFMAWKRTGQFAQNLVKRAKVEGDPRLLAYACGYRVAFAAKVCGSGFLNSIVGGPYRLHWWRSRWVSMYGDAWVYGYYRHQPGCPTMNGETGDDSSPPYEEWPDLCSANLQQKIEVAPGGSDPDAVLAAVKDGTGLPGTLPAEFVDFWFGALEGTFGDLGAGGRFRKDQFDRAYQLTWLMLWFQTSGDVLGCPRLDLKPPSPGGCGTKPDWVDTADAKPAGSGDTGTGPVPPQPSPMQDIDEGKVACGVALALFGLALGFLNGAAAGLLAFGKSIALIIDGVKELDWNDLLCKL